MNCDTCNIHELSTHIQISEFQEAFYLFDMDKDGLFFNLSIISSFLFLMYIPLLFVHVMLQFVMPLLSSSFIFLMGFGPMIFIQFLDQNLDEVLSTKSIYIIYAYRLKQTKLFMTIWPRVSETSLSLLRHPMRPSFSSNGNL